MGPGKQVPNRSAPRIMVGSSPRPKDIDAAVGAGITRRCLKRLARGSGRGRPPMKKLRIAVIDLVSRGPCSLFMRVMGPNLASIMPQAVAAWGTQEGHDVTFLCYTGTEDLLRAVPADADLVFVGAFTEAAQTAYALSNFCRARGAVTALGGPHARCYPQDALRYFDYVLGFTDREALRGVLQACEQHRPLGVHIAARQQPTSLPGVRERWPFIEAVLKKAPVLKIVPL